jgi:hypothetical protein
VIFGAVQYEGPGSSFSTRGYDGQIPGPIMRVAAGETLLVTVTNDLKDIGMLGAFAGACFQELTRQQLVFFKTANALFFFFYQTIAMGARTRWAGSTPQTSTPMACT